MTQDVMLELFGSENFDPAAPPHIEPPFRCDYGSNISFGRDVFINYSCTILDCGRVTIGSRVLFGPNVSLLGATHPVHPLLRNGTQGAELGRPVRIGDDVWLGAGVTVLPGITIGNGATVGASAVVTRYVEPLSIVAGNPARLIRRLPPTTSEAELQEYRNPGAADATADADADTTV